MLSFVSAAPFFTEVTFSAADVFADSAFDFIVSFAVVVFSTATFLVAFICWVASVFKVDTVLVSANEVAETAIATPNANNVFNAFM